MDEVRRRVQQDTLGHRGRTSDPLYGIRRTEADRRQAPHREADPPAEREARGRGPHHEVTLAWHCYQQLRAVYHVRPEQGRQLVAAVPSNPISEIALLGRTLRRWKAAILTYFDTAGASNGPIEAVCDRDDVQGRPRIRRASATTGYARSSRPAVTGPGDEPLPIPKCEGPITHVPIPSTTEKI